MRVRISSLNWLELTNGNSARHTFTLTSVLSLRARKTWDMPFKRRFVTTLHNQRPDIAGRLQSPAVQRRRFRLRQFPALPQAHPIVPGLPHGVAGRQVMLAELVAFHELGEN